MTFPPSRPHGFLSMALVLVLVACVRGVAESPANSSFDDTWRRTDQPVAASQVSRTWMWGPEGFTGELSETYTEAPRGQRTVQYFDKSRMELNDPDGDRNDPWHVTNGLLVVELMNGKIQTGDIDFLPRRPSVANVAGDANDPNGPTYATLAMIAGRAPLPEGSVITQTLSRQGAIGNSQPAAVHNVTAGPLSPETNHRTASVFWQFMNSSGQVSEGRDSLVIAPLFPNPYYATGLPIAEAYWATVQVGGQSKMVLIQAFERRVLTYTPDNPDGWKVEAGNVGQHYYQWRYENSDFVKVEVTNGDRTVTLQIEVADTPSLRACGLMHRYSMLPNQAMLFVFDSDGAGGFWNRNTEIPLQLAWIDANGIIVGISDMNAADRSSPSYPETTHAEGTYRYVIEANAGWFTMNGFGPGDQVNLNAAVAHGSQGATPICDVLGTQEKPANPQ